MNKNNQFKLIRYSRITSSFEVSKEHFDEFDPGEKVLYGESYTHNNIVDYKIKNDEQT